MKKVMITGANAGLGKECAKQVAQLDGIEKIYLACRNPKKALSAKQALEAETGKSIFEIVIMDVANLDSVQRAVHAFDDTIDGLVMNAGGLGGENFLKSTPDGVTNITAINLLGHVQLTEDLIKQNKLTGVVLYAGSEAARGVPRLKITQPRLTSGSADEFTSICNGSYFDQTDDPMPAYAQVKFMGALWISALARKYPAIRFVTVSPGHTGGTQIAEEMPAFKKFIFKFGFKVLPLFGMAHDLQTGCKRYIDGLTNAKLTTGIFYASKQNVLTGPVIDQSTIFSTLNNQTYQDNAYTALQSFIK